MTLITISPIALIPDDTMELILEYAGNPRASEVSRHFHELNAETWAKVIQPVLEQNALIGAYLERSSERGLPTLELLKRTYSQMSKDLSIAQLPPGILNSICPKLCIPKAPSFQADPTVFFRMVNQMEDLSLERAWPTLRDSIHLTIPDPRPNWGEVVFFPASEIRGMPKETGPVKEIRDWLIAEENQALIQTIRKVDLSSKRLLVIPDALKRFTGLRDLNLSGNQIRILPPEFLSSFPHLEELRLKGNLIRKVPPNFLQHNQQMRIFLSWNPLKQIPAVPPQTEITTSAYTERMRGLKEEHDRSQARLTGVEATIWNGINFVHIQVCKPLNAIDVLPGELLTKNGLWDFLY